MFLLNCNKQEVSENAESWFARFRSRAYMCDKSKMCLLAYQARIPCKRISRFPRFISEKESEFICHSDAAISQSDFFEGCGGNAEYDVILD